MVAAWVWWCAVCTLCACGARGAAVDVDVVVTVNGTGARGTKHSYHISGQLIVELVPQKYSEASLLVAGGEVGDVTVADVEVLNLKQGQWRNVEELLSPLSRLGLAVVNGKMYAMGGFHSAQHLCLRSVDVYDIATNTWTPGPSLSECRSDFAVAVIGSTIYVVGGSNLDWLESAEALDEGATAWRPIANMHKNVEFPRAVVIGDQLHVVGGHNGQAETVERYDPVANAWEIVPQKTKLWETGYGVGAVDRTLYLVGGSDWRDVFKTVMRSQITETGLGEWSEAPPMHVARWWPTVTTYDGKLYVVGGYDPSYKSFNTVEVFDPATETWTLLNATMSLARKRANAIVVEHGPL